jgi:hypothetical protein
MLEIGGVVAVVGLVLTIISFTYSFAHPRPGWLLSYQNVVARPEGDYNLILFIVGPIMLLMGGFYFGEQLMLRRRFEKLLDTPKRSEFAGRRKDLDDLAKRLPSSFETRIEEKESEFKSKRAT